MSPDQAIKVTSFGMQIQFSIPASSIKRHWFWPALQRKKALPRKMRDACFFFYVPQLALMLVVQKKRPNSSRDHLVTTADANAISNQAKHHRNINGMGCTAEKERKNSKCTCLAILSVMVAYSCF